MTDQTPQGPTFTEAPTSFNVKYFMRGFDCQLTIRANTADELMPRAAKVIDWLVQHEAVPARSQPNGYMPAAPSTPAAAPAAQQQQPQAPAQPQGQPAGAALETMKVISVSHKVSDSGKHLVRAKGGRYTKHGITAWEEVIPVAGWQEWQVGAEFVPPAGMEYAVVQDGKKVTQFKSTP